MPTCDTLRGLFLPPEETLSETPLGEKLSFHFNGSDETVEVVLRTVISVNQLSVHGTVADMCGELALEIAKCSKGTGKPVAPDNLETMVMPPEVSTTDQASPTDARVQGNL